MLYSMAYTQTDLDNINSEILNVEQTTEVVGDRRVTYRPMSELLQIKAAIEADLNATSTTKMSPRYRGADFSG